MVILLIFCQTILENGCDVFVSKNRAFTTTGSCKICAYSPNQSNRKTNPFARREKHLRNPQMTLPFPKHTHTTDTRKTALTKSIPRKNLPSDLLRFKAEDEAVNIQSRSLTNEITVIAKRVHSQSLTPGSISPRFPLSLSCFFFHFFLYRFLFSFSFYQPSTTTKTPGGMSGVQRAGHCFGTASKATGTMT